MRRMLAAELTEFIHFKSVRVVLFVFHAVVITLFAFAAG